MGNRDTPMIFISYVNNHAWDCYCMYNPNAGYVTKTRDIMWLHHMYYSKPDTGDKVLVYRQVALPFEPEDEEPRERLTLNASEPKVECKDEKKEWRTIHTRLGRVMKPPVLYMKEFGADGIEAIISTIHQNNYSQFCNLDDEETTNIEIAAVGARLGSRFNHTGKLKVMKFKEGMNRPDSNKWKEEIKNEHK